MKRTTWLISTLVVPVLVLATINILQWTRSQNVSARPAIVFGWSEVGGASEDDIHFQAFKETVSSKEFIERILQNPRYKGIRQRFEILSNVVDGELLSISI